MSPKKKEEKEHEKESSKEDTKDDILEDFEEDFDEDFEEDLDIEEELDLLDTEDIDSELTTQETVIDKDEELKQLYLSSGIHIGTKLLTGDFRSRNWQYRITNYGLWVIDLVKTSERIKIAAKFLSKFIEEGSDSVIVSSVRRYGKEPVKKFCEVLGCKAIINRYIPGSLTNPQLPSDYYIKDPKVIFIVDPHADKVILKEAQLARIPVVSIIDTDDVLTNVDLAIPANNRGKKSLGLIFFLLARYIMLELGKIASEEEFPYTVEEFTSKIIPYYRQQ
ncbi:MAG: 30S ribosomal protein S2 [Promethearchaeota archaeon]